MSSPFVPVYRQFPTSDAHNLERQLVNFHVSTNTAVNNRIIGTFDLESLPNGERWFPIPNQERQRDGNRLVVQVSNSTLVVNHNITKINQVTRLYGAFFDGTYWQALPYVDTVAANQIGLKVSSTQIIVTKGGGAPSISSGVVVLEWL